MKKQTKIVMLISIFIQTDQRMLVSIDKESFEIVKASFRQKIRSYSQQICAQLWVLGLRILSLKINFELKGIKKNCKADQYNKVKNIKKEKSIRHNVQQKRMKVSLSRPQSKKIKSAMTSKKNSHTNSLIYKEINSQMEQLFSKSKYINHQIVSKDKPTIKQDKQQKPNKKTTYINMKKKPEKAALSSSHDPSKLLLNKLHNNFMAGMNSPVSGSENSDNEEQCNVDFMQMKKNIGIKPSHPTISPSILKTAISTSQSRQRSEKQSQNPTPIPSSSTTPSGTLSKKSYTKTKIKLETKIFSNFKLERKLFCYDYIIGKGGFGKVWKVEHIKTRNNYAMKQMLKSIVITKKSVQSVMNERVLLSQLNSPFLVNMHYAFQDRDTLYLVLDLMQGGDLRYHIGNKVFSQIQSKFFVACIILGLEHMHRCNIIHRDIKPQNLVLDSRGYIRITDLGIARTFRINNSSDTSGTPGYMSPQVICRQNHSFVSDFFALGVIAYELMTGKRPYNGRTRNQIRQNMLAKQAQIKPSELPEGWSFEAADFINRLIQRKPQNRLGFHGIQQIKNHPWIRTINWERLYSKEIQSPFIPLMRKKNFDQDQQITIEDEEEAAMIEKNSLLLRKPEFQQLFKDYFYDQNENLQTAKEAKKMSVTSASITPTGISVHQIQKESKKKLSTSKQKQKLGNEKASISQKLAGKKFSQQLYIKRTTNATIESLEKDSTLRNKKGPNDLSEANSGKGMDLNEPNMIKDCQVIQSLNNSEIMEAECVAQVREKRKNSQPITTSKTFFKDFRF